MTEEEIESEKKQLEKLYMINYITEKNERNERSKRLTMTEKRGEQHVYHNPSN